MEFLEDRRRNGDKIFYDMKAELVARAAADKDDPVVDDRKDDSAAHAGAGAGAIQVSSSQGTVIAQTIYM